MIDKNYILSRLNAGESMEDIGNSIAAAMNAANEELMRQAAEAEAQARAKATEQRKTELLNNLIAIVQEWAEMEGIPASDIQVSESEAAQLMDAMNASFQLLRDVKKLAARLEEAPVQVRAVKREPVTDDQILAEFAKMFS